MILTQDTIFAHNVLGSVDVPRVYDADTSAIVALATSTLTTAEKNKLDDFILDMKANGLWSLCSSIFIPKLWHNLTDFEIDIKEAVKRTFTTKTGYAFTDGLGVSVQAASVDQTMSIAAINCEECHIGFYNSTSIDSTTLDVVGSSNSGRIGKSSIFYKTGGVTATKKGSNSLLSGVTIGSISENNDLISNINNGVVSNFTETGDILSQTVSTITVYKGRTANFGFYTFGNSLTTAQLTKYSELINNLMA